MAERSKMTMNDLLEKGKASGKLTTKEINDFLTDMDYDVEQIESLWEEYFTKVPEDETKFF